MEKINNKINGLNLFGYWGKEFGLANILYYFVNALPTDINHAKVYMDSYSQTFRKYKEENMTIPKFPLNIYISTPHGISSTKSNLPPEYFLNKYEVGIWFWELENLNPKYIRAFNEVDEVWAFTDFIKKSFSNVSPFPVYKIPFPYKSPEINQSLNKNNNKPFTFLMSFDYASDYERKNPEGVIKAFISAFGNDSEKRLIIKTINSNKYPELKEKVEEISRNFNNIKIINKHLKRKEYYELFLISDVYMSLHRAEGLGLNILDSIWFEKPVILTKYGGPEEFFPKNYPLFVSFKKSNVKSIVKSYKFSCKWAEPDIKEASEKMIWISKNYEKALKNIKKVKLTLENKYNKNEFLRFLEERLRKIHKKHYKKNRKNELPLSLKNNLYLKISKIKLKDNNKTLIFYTAPEERILRIIDAFNYSLKKNEIFVFGKYSKKIKSFSKNYFIYENEGKYLIKHIDKMLLYSLKKMRFDLIIVPFYNKTGKEYDNIFSIVKELNFKKVYGITIDNKVKKLDLK